MDHSSFFVKNLPYFFLYMSLYFCATDYQMECLFLGCVNDFRVLFEWCISNKVFSTQAHVCYYRVSNGGKNATREVAAYTLEVACCDLSLFKTTNYVKLSHMLGGLATK